MFYMKIRVRCTPNPSVKQTVNAYKQLNDLIKNEIESSWGTLNGWFNLEEDDESISFVDNEFVADEDFDCNHPENAKGIEFAFLTEGYFPEEAIFDVLEDRFPLSYQVVFATEAENDIPDVTDNGAPDWEITKMQELAVTGCINNKVVGWREDDNIPLTAQEAENCPFKDRIYAYPENDKVKHEMFLMAWNGNAPEDMEDDPDFFNSKNLDDAYMYDADNKLPDLNEWMTALYERKTKESIIG